MWAYQIPLDLVATILLLPLHLLETTLCEPINTALAHPENGRQKEAAAHMNNLRECHIHVSAIVMLSESLQLPSKQVLKSVNPDI